MLDGLLGRGFSSKCKSLIKATRTRIDVLRRRKEATQRFLKGNLAQLLSNGLDINAFGRTEEFLSGLNSLACYDFLEHSCEYILKKLSMMQKHSECPEECREAVGSLMFAAARFSDLPELRDLRDALQEKYGSSLEHFVNQKFVERLAIKTPTIDKKIQLLQDIALELSIKWDSRGFQQRMMANPSVPVQAKKQETNLDCGTANKMHVDNEIAVNSNKPHQLLKMRSELTSDRLKAKNGGQSYLMRKDELGHRSFGGVESTSNRGKSHMGSERNIAKRDDYGNRGLQEKSELSNDELLANKVKDNYVMRKDELGHRSFGGIASTGNSGKPQMGSEENTARRYNYDMIPQERRDKSDLSSDELRAKNGGQNYIMRKVELGHRSFEGAESNSGRPPMGIEQNTPRGRRENGELSSDELRAKNRRKNYLMRNDELDHLSTGRGQQTVNNVKPHTGSEHNIHRRDYYDGTPLGGLQDGEFSYGLGATNGRGHYFIRKDEDILSPEQGDSRGNRCNPHTGLERSIPRREKNGIISVGRLEDGKFDYDGLQAKHGRANSLMTKDELAHQTYGRSDLRGTNTARREINNISSHHGKELTGDKNEPTRMNGKEDTVQRRDGHVSSSRGKRPEVTGGIFEAQNDQIYGFPKSSDFVEELPIIRDGKIVSSADCRDYKKPKAAKSHKIIQEEDTYRVKPHSNYAIPPPYVKSKDLPPYMKTVEGKKVISDHGGSSLDPTTHSRDDEKDLSYFEDLRTGHARVRSLGHEKDVPYHDNIPLPKPRSIRRKHSKSSSHRDDLDDFEDLEVVKRISSSRRRDHHHSKKGLQILFEEEHKQKDDEERKIDKLLLHYSKKPSTLEEEKARRKVKTHARENPHNEEASGFPTRSVSLPRENITSDEQVKVYARANSFQPDKSAGHVHPKLPDYDDLAAQFAALKGR